MKLGFLLIAVLTVVAGQKSSTGTIAAPSPVFTNVPAFRIITSDASQGIKGPSFGFLISVVAGFVLLL